ncbi:MAG: hypothetical protein AMK69_00150, partial [Nitrospira bacterium SG8_3]
HIKTPPFSYEQWALEISLFSNLEMIFSRLDLRLIFMGTASESETWKGKKSATQSLVPRPRQVKV